MTNLTFSEVPKTKTEVLDNLGLPHEPTGTKYGFEVFPLPLSTRLKCKEGELLFGPNYLPKEEQFFLITNKRHSWALKQKLAHHEKVKKHPFTHAATEEEWEDYAVFRRCANEVVYNLFAFSLQRNPQSETAFCAWGCFPPNQERVDKTTLLQRMQEVSRNYFNAEWAGETNARVICYLLGIDYHYFWYSKP